MSRLIIVFCLASLPLLGACGDPSPSRTADAGITHDADDADSSDAKSDADTGSDPLQRTPPQDGVSPNGHPDIFEELSPGEVRVGRIEAEETGFTGLWAHCREGDFKLYNAEIAVCIQHEETNRFEVFTGGMIVDAKRVGDDSDDVLDFVRPLVGLGTARAESVEVVRDGSEGGPAVLRVESHDVPIGHLVGVIGSSLFDPQGVPITTEYRLDADSDTIEIVSWFSNPNDGVRAFFVGDWFAYGDRGDLWTPGRGMGGPGGRYGWLASVSATSAYGWIIPEGEAQELGLGEQGLPWAGSRATGMRLDSGEDRAWRRWFVVSDSLDTVRQRAAELRDEPLDGDSRTLHVQTADGEPVAGRGVLVKREGEPIAWGRTDEEGSVELTLPDADLQIEVEAWSAGASFEHELSIPAEDTVTIEAPGVLDLEVHDADTGEPMTARIIVRGGSGYTGFARHGTTETELAAGSYEIVVYRGPEYDAATFNLELAAGERVERAIGLERAIDTAGWLSGDFHQHMEPSLDSEARIEDRLTENAALGVDIAISTDHESVTDLRSLVGELGLQDELTAFNGVEISPIETHVGLYPMDYDHDKAGGGTIRLSYLDENGETQRRLIPEVVEIARNLASDPVVQLNHARRSTSGMLELVDYDPVIGPQAVEDHRFTLDFDTMEITNRFGDTCKLFTDWSGLLNAGYRFTGLGNSDTHGLSGESGLPRNYLRIDKAPNEVDAADVRQALRSGRVTVGAHAFIDFAGDTLPGDLIEAQPDEAVELDVRVRTPDWAHAERLLVVVNGEVVQTIDRPDTATSRVDFNESVSVAVSEDSWVIFFAHGPQPGAPIHAGKPVLAFTNPVYIDVDGDTTNDGDLWEAPGPRALSLEAVDQFCN